MTADKHPNLARSRVLTAPSPAASGVTLGVESGDGAAFTPPCRVTAWPQGASPTRANAEIMMVTAQSGDTLDVIRHAETWPGSAARAIGPGWNISATFTAGSLVNSFVPASAAQVNVDTYATLGGAVTTAGAGKQYLLGKASYTESADVSPGAKSSLDGVSPTVTTLTMSGTASVRLASGQAALRGLTVQGPGGVVVPDFVNLQSIEKCVIEDVEADGLSRASGGIGVDVGNHAGVSARNVRVRRQGTGFRFRGCQFSDFYSLKAYDCRIGLDIGSLAGFGGGNSNLFVSPQAIGGEVGILVKDYVGGATPLHSIELISPQVLDNSMCALAAFGADNLNIRGWAAEFNGSGVAATGTYNGDIVKRCSMYLSASRVILDGGYIAEASVTPCIILENGSVLTLRDGAGYGNVLGALVQSDATSGVILTGTYSCVGSIDRVLMCSAYMATARGILGCSPNIYAAAISNAWTSGQAPAFSDTNGAASSTTGTDAVHGNYVQVTYAASVGNQETNRALWADKPFAGAATMLSFVTQASVDTTLDVRQYGVDATAHSIALKAGQWTRVVMMATAGGTGNQHVVISPKDAAGATVKFARFGIISGTDTPPLRREWSACAAGGYAA